MKECLSKLNAENLKPTEILGDPPPPKKKRERERERERERKKPLKTPLNPIIW